MGFGVRDAGLEGTKALPNGAATIYTDAIDLGHGSKGDFLVDAELVIAAPALTTSEQPDAKTLKYDVQHADDAAFTSPVTIAKEVLVQTGAGGAGAAAATARFRLPVDVKRFVRVAAIGSATGNSSTKSVNVGLRL